MRLVILHNHDFDHQPAGVGRLSQDAILGVVDAAATALRARGLEPRIIPVGADPTGFVGELSRERPDGVLNLCESLAGDARGEMIVPALLDLLRVPYTGSGPLALGLALHKPKTKEVLCARGVPTPPFAVVERMERCAALEVPLPAIVKPAHEDASIGIDRHSVVRSRAELERACARVLEGLGQPALVEQYIEGRELNVALFGEPAQPLPIGEIDFTALGPEHPHIVTYAAKWDESSPEYIATPPIRCVLDPATERRVQAVARSAFAALECRDYGRVDIRLSSEGIPYAIEVNPNCDLSPRAGFARAAQFGGLSYEELIWRLVGLALDRGGATEPRAANAPAALFAATAGRERARADS